MCARTELALVFMEVDQLEAAGSELASARKVDAALGLVFQLRVGAAETRLVSLLKKQLKGEAAAASSRSSPSDADDKTEDIGGEATADFEVNSEDGAEEFADASETITEEAHQK